MYNYCVQQIAHENKNRALRQVANKCLLTKAQGRMFKNIKIFYANYNGSILCRTLFSSTLVLIEQTLSTDTVPSIKENVTSPMRGVDKFLVLSEDRKWPPVGHFLYLVLKKVSWKKWTIR